jgi:hypothetical protein
VSDCNSRDPLRWKIFASKDRVKWVQVLDQSENLIFHAKCAHHGHFLYPKP